MRKLTEKKVTEMVHDSMIKSWEGVVRARRGVVHLTSRDGEEFEVIVAKLARGETKAGRRR